jgi:hypothetical protein
LALAVILLPAKEAVALEIGFSPSPPDLQIYGTAFSYDATTDELLITSTAAADFDAVDDTDVVDIQPVDFSMTVSINDAGVFGGGSFAVSGQSTVWGNGTYLTGDLADYLLVPSADGTESTMYFLSGTGPEAGNLLASYYTGGVGVILGGIGYPIDWTQNFSGGIGSVTLDITTPVFTADSPGGLLLLLSGLLLASRHRLRR